MSSPSLVERLRSMAASGWNPIGLEAAKRIEELEEALGDMLHLSDCTKDSWAWGKLDQDIFDKAQAVRNGVNFKETTSG